MSDYITLLGAEDVKQASRTISAAASEMFRAAAAIDDALTRHQRFMDDWLSSLERVLKSHEPGDRA